MDKENSKSYRSARYRQPSTTDQVIPFAVLGLSVGALALSVYAVTGGPVDNYLAARQPNVAYAEEQQTSVDETPDIKEVLGEGEYDIKVQIDEDGERSYVLTPIQSDEIDGDVDESDEDVVDSEETDTAESTSDDVDETSDKTETDEADSSEETDADSETELSEEAQEKLEEHKSMRLRIKPDREGDDIYYYVVEPGDSLAMISEHFNVPLGQLMEDNHIEDGNLIYVGEVIFMPTGFTQ